MQVEFRAYADDYTVGGATEFEGDRLADFLGAAEALAVQDVNLRALESGREYDIPAAVIEADELCAVVASGPRGNPELRVRTRAYPMRAIIGPYTAAGYFHVMPTADPFAVVRHRRVVALRPVRLAYDVNGEHVEETHDTLLLMGAKIEIFEASSDETLELTRALDLALQADRRANKFLGDPAEA